MKNFKFKAYNWNKIPNPKNNIYSFFCKNQEEDVNFLEMDYNSVRAYLITTLYSKNTSSLFCQFSFDSKDKPYGFFEDEYYRGNDLFVKDSPENIINFLLSFNKVIGNSLFIKFEEEISLKDFLSLEKECFSFKNRLKRIINSSKKWIDFWKPYSDSYLIFHLMSGGFDYYSDNLNIIKSITEDEPSSTKSSEFAG